MKHLSLFTFFYRQNKKKTLNTFNLQIVFNIHIIYCHIHMYACVSVCVYITIKLWILVKPKINRQNPSITDYYW